MDNIKDLVDKTCLKYGITEEQLKSNSRFSLFVMARREIACELRKVGFSYASIGFILNKKDHTTIMNYVNPK